MTERETAEATHDGRQKQKMRKRERQKQKREPEQLEAIIKRTEQLLKGTVSPD